MAPVCVHRFRWLGVGLGKPQWWGALSYFAGMVLYLMGDIASLANDCPQTYLTDGQFVSACPSLA